MAIVQGLPESVVKGIHATPGRLLRFKVPWEYIYARLGVRLRWVSAISGSSPRRWRGQQQSVPRWSLRTQSLAKWSQAAAALA